MATFTGFGLSTDLDPVRAAQQAAEQAKKDLGQERIDVAIVFSTLHYDPKQFLPVLFELLLHTRLIGCSTPAIMAGEDVLPCGIAVLIVTSDNIKFESGSVNHLNLLDRNEAGRTLVKNSLTDFGQKQRKLFLCLADGLTDNLSDLICGLKDEFMYSVPLIFAGSSDNYQFIKTYQFYKDQIMTQGACSLMLGGRFPLGLSQQHGFRPIGKPRTIDKVDGEIILSINGRKASALYEEYFEDEAKTLKHGLLGPINFRYPLGIRLPGHRRFLLRNVFGVLDGGGIICQDKVPEGSEVHIMIGSQLSYLEAVERAAFDVRTQLNGQEPQFILIIESLSRYRLLGRHAHQELVAIRKILGTSAPLLGMYSLQEYSNIVEKEKEEEVLLQNANFILMAVA